nr:helix-turn-helix transcriptional regulator [Bacteroidota bacterium]
MIQDIVPKLMFVLLILSVIAIFQSLLMAFFLFFSKKNAPVERNILAFLFLIFSVFISGSLMIMYGQTMTAHSIAHIASLTVFLAPPTLYFFILCKTNPHFQLSWKDLVHFIPFIVVVTVMVFRLSTDKQNVLVFFTPYGISLLTLLFVQNFIYLAKVYQRLHRLGIPVFRFGKSGLSLQHKWLRNLMLVTTSVLIIKLALFVLWNVFSLVGICIFFTGVFFIFSFVILNATILVGLSKPGIYSIPPKYQNSSLSQNISTSYLQTLEDTMKTEMPFLDPLISLEKLAKHVKIPKNQLSQVINTETGLSYNDYINKYRIQQAQSIISKLNGNGETLLGVAYDVGFNSKSTFNTAFKKFTGKTPSEYRKQNRVEAFK